MATDAHSFTYYRNVQRVFRQSGRPIVHPQAFYPQTRVEAFKPRSSILSTLAPEMKNPKPEGSYLFQAQIAKAQLQAHGLHLIGSGRQSQWRCMSVSVLVGEFWGFRLMDCNLSFGIGVGTWGVGSRVQVWGLLYPAADVL